MIFLISSLKTYISVYGIYVSSICEYLQFRSDDNFKFTKCYAVG